MKLYGYDGELAKKIDRIDEAAKNDICAEMLLENLNIDMEKVTLGDFFLKLFSYMCEIPEEYFSKTYSELTEEDIEVLDKTLRFCNKDFRCFTEVM